MAILSILLSATHFPSSPFLSTLLPAALAAFGVQTLFGIHGVLRRSEFLYDFSGGWTFLATLAVAFYVPALRREGGVPGFGGVGDGLWRALDGANWRGLALTGGTAIYAVRCGCSLFFFFFFIPFHLSCQVTVRLLISFGNTCLYVRASDYLGASVDQITAS